MVVQSHHPDVPKQRVFLSEDGSHPMNADVRRRPDLALSTRRDAREWHRVDTLARQSKLLTVDRLQRT